MFGRKAVETGAFRTACTSLALLCVRRLEALAGSQVYYCTGKALCGAVSLWDSPTFRFHFPSCPHKRWWEPLWILTAWWWEGWPRHCSSVILEAQLQVSRLLAECSVPGAAGSRRTPVENPLRPEARLALGGSPEWTGRIFIGCPRLWVAMALVHAMSSSEALYRAVVFPRRGVNFNSTSPQENPCQLYWQYRGPFRKAPDWNWL